MTAWNRRMAAATRVREAHEPEALEERLRALGLPAGMHPDDMTAVAALLRLAESRGTGFGTTLLARVADPDGTTRNVKVVVLANDNGTTTLVGDAEAELHVDPLTGLPGRDHALEMIGEALAGALHADHSIGVFTIDIDRFKTVNDAHGFRAGDEALRSLAVALEELLRPDETLIRMGGDEFVIVCPEVFGVAEAMTLAERFRSVCATAPIDSPLAGLTVSVGVAVGRADRGAEELVRDAETALYQAKGQGRDRTEVFDEDMRTRTERRITVDQQLRHALDHDGIQVHYQPIVEAASRRIVGIEALLRIEGTDGQQTNALELVETAEDSGLIRRIDEIVLQRACEAVLELPERDDPLFLAVNVSDRQLGDSRFPLALARTLNGVGFPAEHLRLEVHRSVFDRKGAAVRLVTQLRALGVGVTVDDFIGANDADLALPDGIDTVKLDKRLVHGVHAGRGRARAELAMSGIRDRQVAVCAVGVETEEDLAAVIELGCTFAQGYLFSPPVDVAQLQALLADD